MKDVFKKDRGRCQHTECSTYQYECPEFMVTTEDSFSCAYCKHLARFHILLSNTEPVCDLNLLNEENPKFTIQDPRSDIGLDVNIGDCSEVLDYRDVVIDPIASTSGLKVPTMKHDLAMGSDKQNSKRARIDKPIAEYNVQEGLSEVLVQVEGDISDSIVNSIELPLRRTTLLKNVLRSEIPPSEEIERLLKASFPLRQASSMKELPFYLYAKKSIMCEISLRMGKSYHTLIEKLVDLEARFKRFSHENMAAMVDVETFLKPSVAKFKGFLTITEDFGSFDEEKRPGPCILFNEVEKDVSLYSMFDGKFIILNGLFDIYEACLVGFGTYYRGYGLSIKLWTVFGST